MKVYLDYKENIHFSAKTRQFTNIEIDEPPSFYGTDKGPSAVEYLLIGVGGCLGSSLAYCLQKNNIDVDTLELIVDGKLEHKGPKLRLRLANIICSIKISVKSEFRESLERCLKEFKEHCVISESLTQGIPLEIKIIK